MSIPAHLILDKTNTWYYFRVKESDGSIIYKNEAFENSFSHIQPANISDLIRVGDDLASVKKAMEKSKTMNIEPTVTYFRLLQKNGAQRWSLWELSENSGVYHFLGNQLFDVVSIQSHEYEQQKALLQTIAWEWSHRIRRPLSNVLGLASLLEKNENLTNEDKEVVNMLVTAANELDSVVAKVIETANRALPRKDD